MKLGVVGLPNVGKSTLFNLIGGTISPSSGKVFFAGNDITGWKPYSIARAGIARTFQTTALFEELPVYVNLVIGHRMRTRSGLWDVILHTPRQKREKNETTAKVLEVLEFTELGEYINAPAGSIPQEAQKRLAIGVALMGNPRLLLLDEPSAALDPRARRHLIDLLRALPEARIVASHDLDLVRDVCPRVVILREGRLFAQGATEDLLRDASLLDAAGLELPLSLLPRP